MNIGDIVFFNKVVRRSYCDVNSGKVYFKYFNPNDLYEICSINPSYVKSEESFSITNISTKDGLKYSFKISEIGTIGLNFRIQKINSILSSQSESQNSHCI